MTRTMTPIVQKSSILPRMPVIRKTKPNIIMPVPPVVVCSPWQLRGKGSRNLAATGHAERISAGIPPATLLIRPAQAEQVVSQVAQHHLLSSRRDPHQPGLAPVALDVVFGRVAEPAVHLHCGVRGRQGCVGGEQFGYVRLLAAQLVVWSLSIRQAARRMATSAAVSRA